MASVTHEPTSTLGQPTTSTASPLAASPPSPRPSAAVAGDPPSVPFHNNIIKPSASLPGKPYNLPKFELTGAAALSENRRHEDEMKRQLAPMTSLNPAKTALMNTPAEPISRPGDAPTSQAPLANQEPAPEAPNSSLVAEPMQIDGEQQNGAMITSSPEANDETSGPSKGLERADSKKRPGSPISKSEEQRSNKAFTYPPPPEPEIPSPARNMSLPNSGMKSGAVKKHRCPHCSTEFTRHHNLKSHLLTHSQEKPYGCEKCSQRFRRLHDLKRHLKLHTGERPHECNICGRKFARGDALARHNKGPGGCAGRRESVGGDDDYGDEGDMDGDGSYPEDGNEGLSNDEQMADIHRRRSEPNKRGRRPSSRVDPHGANFRHHSSTYPPVVPFSSAPRSEMPPPGSSATGQPRDNTSQRHLSPHPPGASFNSVHYNGPASMYAHGGMTESPKPLSPGQPGLKRNNSDASMNRTRSPSIATKLQHQHFGRSTGGGTPPVSLPPPVPQLPSISSGFDPRFNGAAYQGGSTSSPSGYRPPVVSTQHGSASSGPPSASSQHQSSGGSMREVLGGGAQQHDESRLMDYVRSMETRLHEEKTARIAEREERDHIIHRLQEEMEMLKNQMQGQQVHRSNH